MRLALLISNSDFGGYNDDDNDDDDDDDWLTSIYSKLWVYKGNAESIRIIW